MSGELRDVVLEALSQIDLGSEVQEKTVSDRDMLSASLIDEKEFLSMQREKLILLFEGLLSPEVVDLEKKLELTLRYLQFQLSEIDKRLSEI
ncbi:CiaD-like domain-containing protein [Helicobacter kayseriensis]|uniref:CiaD-like domain-containing protein n=1 Tax=Helicobacter kayseriensis TaxID=2905877 RepID=UPI001E4D3BF3|nr:hypothetical protein [Helicobacter kayseriensis]MCE3046634.1 hypothetical protein [Helicobacter kayseriensis]MCE3048064.1 hypothetical protein [Helicobacter kayseriensis]